MGQAGGVPGHRVWTHNVRLLKARYPEIASRVAASGSSESAGIEVYRARSGLPTLAVSRGDRTIHLHSTYDPEAEARRWVESLTTGASVMKSVVVLGLGLGYHIEQLLNRYPACRCIVVEPDVRVLAAACKARDLRRLLQYPSLELVVTPTADGIAQHEYRIIAGDVLVHPEVVVWPPSRRLHDELWRQVQARVSNLLRQRIVNVATENTFSVQWLINFFANLLLSVEDPGVQHLLSPFAGRPAIVVSAGPSLDRNGHLLSLAKGRALIVAAGSAIKPLRRLGVEPDLLVSIDPSENNYRLHFQDLDSTGLPLVYAPTIYQLIPRNYAGPRFVAGLDVFPFADWLFSAIGEPKGVLASGPSVANTAWDLLRQMGCHPIILVGQDLAYTDNRTHAAGTAHAQTVNPAPAEEASRFIRVPGIDGQPVLSTRVFVTMREFFEQRIAQYRGKTLTINSTERGARIAGADTLPLKEAIATYCGDPFWPYDVIMSIHAQEKKRLASTGCSDRMKGVLEDLAKQLEQIDAIFQRALESGRALLESAEGGRLTPKAYEVAGAAFRRLDQEMAHIEAYRYVVRPTLNAVAAAVESRSVKELREEPDLAKRANALVSIYLTWFESAWQRAQQVQALVKVPLKGCATQSGL